MRPVSIYKEVMLSAIYPSLSCYDSTMWSIFTLNDKLLGCYNDSLYFAQTSPWVPPTMPEKLLFLCHTREILFQPSRRLSFHLDDRLQMTKKLNASTIELNSWFGSYNDLALHCSNILFKGPRSIFLKSLPANTVFGLHIGTIHGPISAQRSREAHQVPRRSLWQPTTWFE